mmetsp:Transcript_9255/g.38930  ORF Transcript_9255/g.38930 Transcript_9255/m.38930 type:complete len:288 (-) Transcript_9255:651-1514(-)
MSARSCNAGSSWPMATRFPPRGTDLLKKRPIAASVVPEPTSPAHATRLTTFPRSRSSAYAAGRTDRESSRDRAMCLDSSTACSRGMVSASVPEGWITMRPLPPQNKFSTRSRTSSMSSISACSSPSHSLCTINFDASSAPSVGEDDVHVPRCSRSGARAYMPVKYLFSLCSPWKVERSSLPFSIRHTTLSCTMRSSRERTSAVTRSVSLKRRVWPGEPNSSASGSGNMISAMSMPFSGTRRTSTRLSSSISASHTERVTRWTSSRPSMRGEPMRKRTPHPAVWLMCV